MTLPDGIGTLDPRVRSFVSPMRLVWVSPDGVQDPENLLRPGDSACTLVPKSGSVLLDYGRELHGGVRIVCPQSEKRGLALVRVRFGESVTEAMSDPDNDHTPHDYTVPIPWWGHMEIGTTGFRFVRLDLLEAEGPVLISEVPAVYIRRPLERQGTFRCNDERLNEIFDVGVHTVHLCMQDFVWDGIKRDRMVWIGDLHPETKVICSVFGEQDVVARSLDYARDHFPLPGWMNGISSYSLWWIRCHADWFRYHGNREYLAEQRDYLTGLLRHLVSLVDEAGQEHLDGHRFLEWPTCEDPTAIDFGLQALMALALQSGAELCDALGEEPLGRLCRQTADRAQKCRRAGTAAKVAHALAVLAGMEDPVATNRSLLSQDPNRGLSTFYGYYVLEARAAAGDIAGCLDLIRTYWGGMLDLGATSFWEGFEIDWLDNAGRIDELVPPGKRDVHAEYGNWCYKGLRHSLCHGWAAGPSAWLIEHVLGLQPAKAGFAEATLRPHLGDLEWAEGSIATPWGPIRVRHERTPGGEVRSEILEAPGEVLVQR